MWRIVVMEQAVEKLLRAEGVILEKMELETKALRILAIDTCGEGAGVAVSEGTTVCAIRELPSRAASAQIIAIIRDLMTSLGWSLSELDGIGVVAGPGSFTGVRTGLAAAKGICEATGLPLATVSRLEVLAQAASLESGVAVLGAGRRDLYVLRNVDGVTSETMSTVDTVIGEISSGSLQGAKVVVAEASLLELLKPLQAVLHPLRVADAVPLLQDALRDGGTDLAAVDANYVRRESELYAKQAGCVGVSL